MSTDQNIAGAAHNRPRSPRVLVRALSHKITVFLGRKFPTISPLTFVVGYPKSGTTWVCQIVADYLALPFPRYSLLPLAFEAVSHGHELVQPDMPRVVYVMRDGRDAIVSEYFFVSRFVPEGDNPPIPRVYRRLFRGMRNKADVRENLPAFIEGVMNRARPSRPWPVHVRSYFESRHPCMVMLRYEDLLGERAAECLALAMAGLTGEEPDVDRARLGLDRFAFSKLVKRRPGAQGSKFLRKGQAGDWRRHFTPEAARLFDHYAGEELVRAGYEPDRSWVSRVGLSTDNAEVHNVVPVH